MPIRKTRNVSLTPKLEAFIDETVASSRYGSASEVVRAALRLLEREEQDRRQSAATSQSVRSQEGRVNHHGG